MRRGICNAYFEWLIELVCGDIFSPQISYMELLSYLHDIEFTFSVPMDENRACDGVDLRRRFALYEGYEDSYDLVMDYLDGPCSVLEMMVALAIRCEETITDDPSRGDRTQHWFWEMIKNLGLNPMTDDRFNIVYVRDTVSKFLNREYSPDGRGGLFYIRDCSRDLRDVEIWYQLCWYLDSVEY